MATAVPLSNPLGILAVLAALLAATILIFYLVKKPATTLGVKLWMFLGLGVFPAIAGASSTVTGMERTTQRDFCGSCHVMTAHDDDAADPKSQSLAARHSRNPFFGDRSCYVCHADYGMYGYAMTKAGGMRHVYEYYLGGYKDMPLEEAVRVIRVRKPYDNTNCRQCHTTSLHDWRRVPDHESLRAELETNKVSCASAGCHGFAHPFSKPEAKSPAKPAASASSPGSVNPPPSAAPSGSVR